MRNGEADLPAYLDSVAGYCNALVALDDGSTDGTRALLESHPLVTDVLANPRRDTYRGWDDAGNRRRLLDASASARPDWILWLDADERLAPDDGRALRGFVSTDALPGCVYGLQHYRMWGADRCDPDFAWIYRLFAWRAGMTLPVERLHFDPVPVDIEHARWLRTTIRVQHFGAADERTRIARLAKYGEADPDNEFGVDFGGLSEVPHATVPWTPRPADLPVLAER